MTWGAAETIQADTFKELADHRAETERLRNCMVTSIELVGDEHARRYVEDGALELDAEELKPGEEWWECVTVG